MPYPNPPKSKQYDDWFPDIAERGVPSSKGTRVVESTALAVQPDNSGGSDSADTLSAPKKMEFGVLRLWLAGAGRSSRSFDDGPSFDFSAHGLTPPPQVGEDDFNFAPGSEEKDVQIRFEVHGLENIKSAKLELYCRGVKAPAWEHHWGDAWGKKSAEIGAFRSLCKPGALTSEGEMPFANVAVSKTLKVMEGGTDVTAFPKGLLTVARSPYQLRLTLSGCDAKGTPPDGDDGAYPMTGWTYLHVLIHSFKFKFGKKEWLSKDRPDIDQEFREKIVGTRKSDDFGREGALLEELRGFTKTSDKVDAEENMDGSAHHAVALLANHNKRRGAKVDFETMRKTWGNGPRLPIVAGALLRTLAKASTDTGAADALAGARLLWDWSESGVDRWKKATATPTIGDAAKTNEFLEQLHDRPAKSALPKGSYNCPKELGGKLGDSDLPLFLPQPTAGDGKGSLPFEVKPCATRSWSQISSFTEQGESGVMLQPSRFAGDLYKVRAFLYDESLDITDALADDCSAMGSPGVFEVFRRIGIEHLVIGDMPGMDLDGLKRDMRAKAALQVNLLLQFKTTTYTGTDYVDLMKEAMKELVQSTRGGVSQFRYFGLELPRALALDGNPGSALMKVKPRAAFERSVARLFDHGAIRMIKKSGGTEALYGDAVVGSKNQSKGVLIDLDDSFGGERILYLLSEPGAKPFEAGETLTGVYSGKTMTVTLASKTHSCMGVVATFNNTRAHGKKVMVTFPGVKKSVELVFTKGTLSVGSVRSALTDPMKRELKDAFIESAGKFKDDDTYEIEYAGHKGTSTNSIRRVDNVADYLNELKRQVIIERSRVRLEYTGKSPLYGKQYEYPSLLFATKSLFSSLVEAIALAHVKKEKLTEGLLLIHCSRTSNLCDLPDKVNAKDVSRDGATRYVDFTDYVTGGFVDKSVSEASDAIGFERKEWKDVGFIYLVTPDPTSDTNAFKNRPERLKKPWAVALHEIGHGLCLQHANRAPGREGEIGADSPSAREHTKDESCIMSYDSKSDQFCGLCMVRLRGWPWDRYASDGKSTPVRLAFQIGDIDSLFGAGADTEAGKRARLQVLGLFNRPLQLERDGYFKDEFRECWDYSWKMAKRLLPEVDREPEKTLRQAVRDYIFEDGKIPAPNAQGRIRVWGHYHPFYANMDMAMRHGDATKKDSKENAFKMNAFIGDIEAGAQAANPALGAYPIEVLVTDESGQAMPGVEVYIQLVEPKPETPYDPAFAGKPLLGGTSFVKNSGAPSLETTDLTRRIKKFFTDHVTGHDPSPGDDPQKDNVHAALGGKRKLAATQGDLVTPRAVDGQRNVFCPADAAASGGVVVPLKQPSPPSGGAPMKFTALVRADEEGVARFLFCPATVGGDRYRLKATVFDPSDPSKKLAELETGEMVVWRTMRIGGYYQMPNATRLKDMPRSLHGGIAGRAIDPEVLYRPLMPLPLRTTVVDELARAYCEVIVEEAALRPQLLDERFWDRFMGEVDRLAPDYNTEFLLLVGAAMGCETILRPVTGRPNSFSGQIEACQPGRVALVFPNSSFGLALSSAHAQAWDPEAPEDAKKGKFKKIKAKEYIFGVDVDPGTDHPIMKMAGGSYKASTDSAIEFEDTSEVNYETGEVTVTYKKSIQEHFAASFVGVNSAYLVGTPTCVGATFDNTFNGRLWISIEGKSRDRFDLQFFKSKSRHKNDLVAKATGAKASDKGVIAGPRNRSGITITFDMGNGPEDGKVVLFNTGIPLVTCLYFPKKILDYHAALEKVARSPFLFNFRDYEEYNLQRGNDFPAATPDVGNSSLYEKSSGKKGDYSWGETVFLRALSAALADQQGFCYYPGQLYVQANLMNVIEGMQYGGKGVGNTALVFNKGTTSADMVHYLLLHETGHCLYGVHADSEAGFKRSFHDNDATMRCIMAGPENLEPGYTGAKKSLRTFCGKCLAGLRGMLAMEDPLYSAGLNGGVADPKTFGDSKLARRPAVDSPSDGLRLSIGERDPHLLPEPDDKPKVAEIIVLPEDDEVLDEVTETASTTAELIPQNRGNWCWAAASLMMRKHYLKETLSQEALVSEALFGDGKDVDDPSHGDPNLEHALSLTGLTHNDTGEGVAIGWEALRIEIDADRPFIIARPHHYLVCYGYEESGKNKSLLLFDPLPVGVGARKRVSYEDYLGYLFDESPVHQGATFFEFKVKTG